MESALVHPPVGHEAELHPGQQRRNADQRQDADLAGQQPLGGVGRDDQRQDDEVAGLPRRPLRVPGPPPQSAPDGDRGARKPGDAAEDPAAEPRGAVAERTGVREYRAEPRDEAEQAVGDQERAEADLEIRRVDEVQKEHARGNPHRAADDEGQHAADGDGAADVGDGPDLADDGADDDQRSGDDGFHDVQPEAERHESDPETREAGDETGREGSRRHPEKCRVHVTTAPPGTAPIMGRARRRHNRPSVRSQKIY